MVLSTIYFLEYSVYDLYFNHDCIMQKFDSILQNQPQLNYHKIFGCWGSTSCARHTQCNTSSWEWWGVKRGVKKRIVVPCWDGTSMRVHSVAFSATLPYPLMGCCPDPITSNSGSVLNGVASYYGMLQRVALSIVCPAAKVYDLVLGGSAAIPLFSLLLRLGSGYTLGTIC